MDDNRIVELYLARDESAIRETHTKYGTSLHRLSNNIVRCDPDAQECVSDTYMQAWRSIPPHEPRTYLFAYLARIVRHLSLNRVKYESRRKRAAPLTELTDEMRECIPAAADVESILEDRAITDALNAFLRTLDTDVRKVFLRRYWYAENIGQISRDFGWSRSRVTSLLFRTRKALKIYLEENDIWI